MNQNNLAIPGSIVVAGIIIAGAIILSGGGGGTATTGTGGTDTTGTAPEPLSTEEALKLAAIQPGDHVRGDRNADVYILEFSDPECPFCKQFHTTLQQVMTEYNGQIAWVYRNFPLASLHRKAPREAEALECAGDLAGNDGFWAYTDRLYEITPSNDGLLDTQLPEIAQFVGIDPNAFQTCLDSGKYTTEVQKDFDNAIALGGQGTPHSLIIAGDEIVPIPGAQPFENVKSQLDRLLNQ